MAAAERAAKEAKEKAEEALMNEENLRKLINRIVTSPVLILIFLGAVVAAVALSALLLIR
jgi:cell division septal protein FtsQ